MLTSFIVRLVDWSVRRPIWVIALALALTTLSGVYVAQHFRINTDVSQLVENEPQWAALGRALDRAFPQRDQTILAVIEAPAPELADAAADALAAGLKSPAYAASIGDVFEPGGGPLFDHDGLLFVSTREVAGTTSQLVSARPLINTLAHDPSLTGLATTLSTMLGLPLQSGQVTLPGLATLFERSADTVDAVLAGKPAAFSWQAGAEASDTIRAAAVALDLEKRYGAVVRLTGEQPLADEEFASVEDGAALNGIITLVVVLVILWLALRSMRMIVAVFLTLAVGLPITTALGLMMVGSLNMISVAFMVLFIGLGADFAIQYGVKYREEHFRDSRLDHALVGAAHSMGMPLTLASAAVATSFFSFMPTAYRGVSELGLIAGVGMMVAYLSTLTVLPALLKCLAPPGEASSPGFPRLTPIDDYLQAHRKPILIGTLVVVVGALPLLAHLEFDFNPLHLKDPTTESMSTLLSLKDSPEAGINDVSVLAPSLGGADATAQRLGRLPEVGRVTTLSSFIPGDQPAKLASIAQAAGALLPALTQQTASPSTDTQRVAALKRASGLLQYAAEDYPGPGAAQAKRLAASLAALAAADAASRDRAEAAFSTPLRLALGQLTMLLQPSAITLDTLPRELVRQWLAPNGQALVQVSPHVAPGADPNDDAMLRRFANAVKQAEPAAIGGPISILYSAHVIIKAFVQAAILAVVSITALLWLTLGRFGDVLRTMIPLLVSALVTLELCVVFRMPLNFANIIALPLMLGVGVAFKVYFVMAWRAGKTSLLSSSLTHAVLFSAATTATAFGSLWLSHHPGTASMGRLLALALLCTLVGAVVFQPILMGKPRKAIAQQQELDGIDG
jgi:hopanoid biosynthesis associated RND transporter like protein HpnN